MARRGVPCLIVLAVDHWSWVASGHLALTHWASERDTNTHLDKGHWTGERGWKRRRKMELLERKSKCS